MSYLDISPDPIMNIADEHECRKQYKGDGECDGRNNVEMCEYDSGDCCLTEGSFCLHCYGDWCRCHETGINYCLTVGKCTKL